MLKGGHHRPEHPIYERLTPLPPLYANNLLFFLAIFISLGAFRDFKSIKDVLAARPQGKESYRILEWDDNICDKPVFPEMSSTAPKPKAKNENVWGKQCSDWARRAGFEEGMGLHAARREVLVKVDGKSPSPAYDTT